MTHLTISLLGPFRVTLNGQPVARFEADAARALLAYLVVAPAIPFRRDALAGLLWPEQPDSNARHALRQTLIRLRRAIGDRETTPPFLQITRTTIQFNQASDYELDVAAFGELISATKKHPHRYLQECKLCMERLHQAAGLHRGDFMAGFSLNSTPFEEWLVVQQEALHRGAIDLLYQLADYHEKLGEYAQVQYYARQQIALEPWHEAAYRQLMRALALTGQRNAAVVQYEICRRTLTQELSIEPEAKTTALSEAIRAEEVRPQVTVWQGDCGASRSASGADSILLPSRLHPSTLSTPPALRDATHSTPLVTREQELARLNDHLRQALAGKGRVTFVTGDAGSGKTTLLTEFARQATMVHADLVVAVGRCDEYAGIGSPYLPFREILRMFGGNVAAQRAEGIITGEQAHRLRALLPATIQTLSQFGRGLVGSFLPEVTLAQCAAGVAGSLVTSPQQLTIRKSFVSQPSPTLTPNAAMVSANSFAQISDVLVATARQHPLLLVLDDLQWADTGSISLLFHLGRRLTGTRILILGAYRAGAIARGRQDKRHPLAMVINELRGCFGDMRINLDQADGRRFVDALVDSEPNRLDAAFRETLYRHTEGHPLFAVELLQDMQARGDLVQDEAGRWTVGANLDWTRLPARVQAVIAERLSRLPADWRAALVAASVEGEEFTAEVVARVAGMDDRELIRHLDDELDRQHHLVRGRALRRLTCDGPLASSGGGRESRYRFQHHMYQQYLYQSMNPVQRARLHEVVDNTLEAFYRNRPDQNSHA